MRWRKSDWMGGITATSIVLVLAGCSFTPKPLTYEDQKQLLHADRIKIQNEVQPLPAGTTLTLDEAVARGLKYNLEYRAKMLEQAIAVGAYDLSKYDMLPKVLANAGYSYRNNYFISTAVGAYSGRPSLGEPFANSQKEYGTAGLSLSWSLLDFGVSYFNALQNADRIVVASERRRHTMHILVQDIRAAYLRAAVSEKLRKDVVRIMHDATIALQDSGKVESQGLRPPLEALRYRRSLLENMKVLEIISQELATAMIELNQLINLPASTKIDLQHPNDLPIPSTYHEVDLGEFEVRALASNADLKESIYNARIAVEETHKSLLKLLPGLTFNVGPQVTNNAYWINSRWLEGSASVSFNLWNLLTAPEAIQLANANKDLASQKRMMVQMAIVSQVYLAKQQLEGSWDIYQRSLEVDTVDARIAKIMTDRARAGTASAAEQVAAESASIVSQLRKYQALAQLFAASGKLQATAGLEPQIGSVNDLSLGQMIEIVREAFRVWDSGQLPALPVSTPLEVAPNKLNPEQSLDLSVPTPPADAPNKLNVELDLGRPPALSVAVAQDIN